MKKLYPLIFAFVCIVLSVKTTKAQCTNADFSSGSFASWTGTWGDANCSYTVYNQNAGFVLGPLNGAPGITSTQYHQTICSTAGGNDPNLALYGATLPMVFPGYAYSGRIGNMWQKVVGSDGNGETITYALTVTPNNCVFTYHYAVVLYDGGHPTGQQPFFNISMTDGNGNDIACGDYEVDATTARTIGGFNHIVSQAVYWKPWSSVLIPLLNYIGQTVKITFTTRGCEPGGCAGSHYAYAYIDAECGTPTLVASSPSICGGGGITLTAPPGAATYTWSGPGITPPANTQTVTVTQPGRDTVVMTTFATIPCTYSIDTFIPGNPLSPTANFSYSPTCVGSPTQFNDLSTPLITGWSWNFNNGAGTSTVQNPSYTFAVPGTYPVALSIVSGSCAADTTLNVVVAPSPTSTFTATGPVCADINSTITYTGTAPPGSTFAWNFDGGTVVSGTGQGPYTVNWANGGTKNITLVVTSGTCPSPVTTEQVVVNPYPVLTITAPDSICIGSNTQLTASGATTYTWAPAASLNATNTASVIATPATTTTYSVTGTSNNCASNTSTTVTVNPIPTSPFTVTTPVCPLQNSTITYTGNASPAAAYAWNFSGGTATPGGTAQGPQLVNWSNPGPQSVSLTVTQNNCVSPPTNMVVIVDTTPTSTFTATSPICIYDTSTITYTGTGNNTATYTWNFGTGTAAPGTGQGPQKVSWASAGSQNITLMVTENGCPSTVTTQTVIVHPTPTANFTVTSPLCVNRPGLISYTGTSSIAAVFTWGFDGGNVASGANRGPYQVSWANGGTYLVSLNISDSGCVGIPDTLPVTVNAIPVSEAGDDTAYCSGNTANIGTNSTPGYAYSWWPVTGLSNATLADPTVNLTNSSSDFPISQAYVVTTTSQMCVSTDTVVITVNPIPVAKFTPPAPRCLKKNDLAFTALGSYMTTARFMWNFGPGATPDSSVFPNQTVIYSTPGTKPVTLTITQSTSHCSVTFPDSVTIYPQPQVGFVPDTVYGCQGLQVCFANNSMAGSPATYLWNFGDGEASDDSLPCHVYQFPGVYTVYLKITSNEGCVEDTTEPDLITVIANPKSMFYPSAQIIQQPESEIDFANLSTNAVRYLWSFNTVGVLNEQIGTDTAVNTSYNFTSYGLYNVILTAYNALGCLDTSQQQIIVTPPQNIFIPNVFTPNGDGRNDDVYVHYQEGVTVLWFRIFDRIGEKVHDGLYPWDGTFKGKPCPPAVYVYEAGFNVVDSSVDIMKKGSITLVR